LKRLRLSCLWGNWDRSRPASLAGGPQRLHLLVAQGVRLRLRARSPTATLTAFNRLCGLWLAYAVGLLAVAAGGASPGKAVGGWRIHLMNRRLLASSKRSAAAGTDRVLKGCGGTLALASTQDPASAGTHRRQENLPKLLIFRGILEQRSPHPTASDRRSSGPCQRGRSWRGARTCCGAAQPPDEQTAAGPS